MAETISFGNWIRQRRRALDLTQHDLAARVGCSISAVRKLEGDERRPSRQVAELLADTLQIPAAERATFVKVARMELGFERLATLEAPVLPAARTPGFGSGMGHEQAVAGTVGSNGAQPPLTLRNLPTPSTPLVGRTVEVVRIAEILSAPECRLLTLTGPGGIGKTRLAIAAAESLAQRFADGVCFVPLAVVTDPESIWAALAGALGFRVRRAEDPKAQLISFLQTKALLLVLDNLEHLLDGVDLIADVVQAATRVRVLATSRERLGLLGEWVFDIHGLGVPAQMPAVAQALPPGWERASAVVLFTQAALRAHPDFELRAEDYPAIVRICQMVEGIPLGIELAAAWVRMLTCQEIAIEIERSLDFLATPARNVPPRQQSLRAAFEHSWRLLPVEERAILQALSVFSGGFTRKAAEAVAGATLLALAALMAKSLAVRSEDGRYDLHEVVRQYAAEKLEEAGEVDAVRRRHWHYFLDMAQTADAAHNSPEYMGLVDQLELETDNIQAALTYLIDHDLEEAWRLAGVLEPYWYRRPVREAERWLARLVASEPHAGRAIAPDLRARVLLIVATFQPSIGETMAMMHEVLALARQGDERRVTALALALLGNEGLLGGGFAESDAMFAEAQRLAEEADDKATLATVLAEQGECARYQGRYARAIELHTASSALAQAIGRTDLIVSSVSSLGKLALRQGDPQKARAVIEPTLAVWEAIHDRIGLASALLLLARAATIQGDYDRGRALIDEAETIFHDTGFRGHDHFMAMVRGNVAYALGDVESAQPLYERAIELCTDAFEPIVMTLAYRGLACCALRQGELATAREAIERSRQICEATHEKWVRALLAFTAGQLAWQSDDHDLAEAHFRTGLQEVLLLGDQCAIAEGLEQMGFTAAHGARPVHAARLLGAADALRRQIGAPLPPIDREAVESAIAAARAALTPEAFDLAWDFGTTAAGRGLEEVVQMALDED
jgi:predicted ATPase/transcriptional regulator with XRE-family HTH domain